MLVYPGAEEPVDSPFYDRLPGIDIADLLWFVASKTGFMGAFNHVLDRYVKQEPEPREILACIVAMGTNMGLWKMAEVSALDHQSLMGASRNYMRMETVRDANDAIANAISALPAFHLYDIGGAMHSSSDGQRMETQIDTVNARYSPKYFGLQKGVSSYTLVANHMPINAKVIGTHEHESHYVFDLLYNNTSDIKPERHSTDTHGTNQVNFWSLYVFGYQFAPRYRDLHKKMDTLVGFQQPSQYDGFLIKPSRKANDELIEKEWPNVQRIMASLAEKDATQATIVRKLGSYTRQNQTKKALWELENICRTIYILDFIDDVVLRQHVQKALNRGEAYHRVAPCRGLRQWWEIPVKTEAEQQIWNECSRLITNAIIYYNTLLLSRAMFRLCVDVFHSQRMKHELLAGDRLFEAVEQSTPAEIVVEVLGGNTVKSFHPTFQAAVVGIDVLHMPNAPAAMPMVARYEAARFDAEVPGYDWIAGIAIGAQHGVASQCRAQGFPGGTKVIKHMVCGDARTALHGHHYRHPLIVFRRVRRRPAPLLGRTRNAVALPFVGATEEGFVRLDNARHTARLLPCQKRQEAMAPVEGAVHRQPDCLGRRPDRHTVAHALCMGQQLVFVAQAYKWRAGERDECLPTGFAAHPLLLADESKKHHLRAGAVDADKGSANPLANQADTFGAFG